MKVDGKTKPIVAFDPDGMLFAMALAPFVRLYNLKQLSSGPFAEFNLEDSIRSVSTHKAQGRFNPQFVGLKFDAKGKHILLTTNQGLVLVLDSFQGTLESVIGDFELSPSQNTEACFSADSTYVFKGSVDGSIRCWNRANASLIRTWDSVHTAPVRCLKFNPIMANFASTCVNLNLWLPRLDTAENSKPSALSRT
jgi:COMPASS component SWD2